MDAIPSSSPSSNNRLPFTITTNPHPQPPIPIPTNETRRRKIIIMLKLQLLVLFIGAFTLFVKLGRTTVVSIPVARLTHPAMEAMATFFPDSTKGQEKESTEARGERVKKERKRAVVQQEERVEMSAVEPRVEVEFQVNNGEMITDHGAGGKERMFTQLELVNVTEEKRGLMNWVMQMEYSGQTFFDGYVLFSVLLET
jgi:hypothetical protein